MPDRIGKLDILIVERRASRSLNGHKLRRKPDNKLLLELEEELQNIYGWSSEKFDVTIVHSYSEAEAFLQRERSYDFCVVYKLKDESRTVDQFANSLFSVQEQLSPKSFNICTFGFEHSLSKTDPITDCAKLITLQSEHQCASGLERALWRLWQTIKNRSGNVISREQRPEALVPLIERLQSDRNHYLRAGPLFYVDGWLAREVRVKQSYMKIFRIEYTELELIERVV